MFFNSLEFFVFFGIIYLLYLMLNHRGQNKMLLFASYFFYGWWDPRFLLLLWISTIVDYYCGIKIHESEEKPTRKKYLLISMVCNLGMLGFFKYFGFFSDSAASLLEMIGLQVNPWSLKVILPVGISFYTFQTMSYTIDIYRRKLKPTHNLLDFALFVSFFPQLVAGPIERARRLLPQIIKPRQLNVIQIKEGIFLIAWGLFKKVIIADNAARIVNYNFAHFETGGFWDIMLGLWAFSAQLYGDFSGYSDIARGLAKLMGFELMVNFRLPYFARNPVDFWARWHISLSTWVRDYLYFSLGSGRTSKIRSAVNNIITMTAIGLWHGAAWTFVIWGFIFGVIQSVYIAIRPILKKNISPKTAKQKAFVKYVSIFVMLHTFYFSGLLFRAESLQHSAGLIKALFRGFRPDMDVLQTLLTVLFYWSPLLVMQVAQYRSKDLMIFMKQKNVVQFAWCLFALCMIVLSYLFGANVQGGEEFIYFQF